MNRPITKIGNGNVINGKYKLMVNIIVAGYGSLKGGQLLFYAKNNLLSINPLSFTMLADVKKILKNKS